MKIFEIVAKCKRMNLPDQIAFLRGELRKCPLRSVRYNEIQSILTGKLTRQLKKELVQGTSQPASAVIGHPAAEAVSA